MIKVTICTNRLTDRDKKSAQDELNKGHMVCIYPTCINSSRCQIIKYQSEEFFNSLGAKPVDDSSDEQSKYLFWMLDHK